MKKRKKKVQYILQKNERDTLVKAPERPVTTSPYKQSPTQPDVIPIPQVVPQLKPTKQATNIQHVKEQPPSQPSQQQYIQKQQYPTQNKCSVCQRSLTYVEQYQRWYCETCGKYQ
jgi:hypothetical protein